MKPDFSAIPYNAAPAPGVSAASVAAALTPEGIPVKPRYGPEDVAAFDHLGFGAGQAPYLRGPYASMYVQNPWTIRSTRAFRRRRPRMLSTAATWRAGRRVERGVRPGHAPGL
jgi:methylmalonyl-CoA mutase